MLSQLTCKDKTKSKTHSQDSIPSFIRKTYDILEERKFPEIIDWNPEGNALVIKKPSEFCQKVLPAYFKHNNLTSFVRQLNMYNFHKRRTQNIDHVYYHELFQRGQKHLLKEIKRKNSEHNIDKTLIKSPETIESPQTPKDIPSLCYENQILKRLYNDAMTKINMLESQVQELSNQNQSLWSQIRSGEPQPLMARFEKSELTQDQLPMTFGDISIPPLKLSYEAPAPIPVSKNLSTTNISGFFSVATEDSGESTEVSHNSPSLHQPSMESEKCFDMAEATPLSTSTEAGCSLPALNLTPQVSQTPQPVKSFDLFASRTEMSVGQIFEAWNNEFQKENQTAKQQEGILGKRQLDTDTFQVPEPLMKRQESNTLFAIKGLISNGLEDKEFFRKMLGRNNSSANEDCEFDLLEFATA